KIFAKSCRIREGDLIFALRWHKSFQDRGIMAAGTTKLRNRPKQKGLSLALPAIVWLLIFFILPVLIVVAISFLTPTSNGRGGELPLTLKHYADAFDFYKPRPVYSPIIVRSI